MTLLLALACACGPKAPPPPTPAEQMAEVVGKIDELSERLDKLKEDTERFDFEDWRDVVPDVRDDAEKLSRELDELKVVAFGLEQELIRAEDPGDYEPPGDPRN